MHVLMKLSSFDDYMIVISLQNCICVSYIVLIISWMVLCCLFLAGFIKVCKLNFELARNLPAMSVIIM